MEKIKPEKNKNCKSGLKPTDTVEKMWKNT